MSVTAPPTRRDSTIAVALGIFVGFAGITHFVNPDFFDAIVPPWLPPNERFWTIVSGIVEVAIAPLLLVPKWRRVGGLAAAALFVAVYPANLYMAWDWRDRPASEQLISYGRLPFQFLFIWLAWRVARSAAANRSQPQSN
ncbi:MAG: hypothetical protein RJB61_1224 [Actinomycetota bacterium]